MSPVVSFEIIVGDARPARSPGAGVHLRPPAPAVVRGAAHALRAAAPGPLVATGWGSLRVLRPTAGVVHRSSAPSPRPGRARGTDPARARRRREVAREAISGLPDAVTVECHYEARGVPASPSRRSAYTGDAQLAGGSPPGLQRQRRLTGVTPSSSREPRRGRRRAARARRRRSAGWRPRASTNSRSESRLRYGRGERR